MSPHGGEDAGRREECRADYAFLSASDGGIESPADYRHPVPPRLPRPDGNFVAVRAELPAATSFGVATWGQGGEPVRVGLDARVGPDHPHASESQVVVYVAVDGAFVDPGLPEASVVLDAVSHGEWMGEIQVRVPEGDPGIHTLHFVWGFSERVTVLGPFALLADEVTARAVAEVGACLEGPRVENLALNALLVSGADERAFYGSLDGTPANARVRLGLMSPSRELLCAQENVIGVILVLDGRPFWPEGMAPGDAVARCHVPLARRAQVDVVLSGLPLDSGHRLEAFALGGLGLRLQSRNLEAAPWYSPGGDELFRVSW